MKYLYQPKTEIRAVSGWSAVMCAERKNRIKGYLRLIRMSKLGKI